MSATIVVDARWARSSGHRTYIANLLPRLGALTPDWRWLLLGDRVHLRRAPWAAFANAEVLHCAAPNYSVHEQLVIPRLVRADVDVYWATHYNIPLLLVRPRLVATVHDMAHLRLPEYTQSASRRLYAGFLHRAILRRATAVMCPSAFSLSEFESLVGPLGSRATVIPHGVEARASGGSAAPGDRSEPYFLFVGNLKPHKGLGTLIAAMSRLPVSVTERLVVVGRSEGLRTPELPDARRAEAERVVFAGEVDDARLGALFAGATALVLPSSYEGFGFPPLEAMASGCPAIVSRAGALPEVCGSAAQYCTPGDADELAAVMARVATSADLRAAMIAAGRRQAARFDWDQSARSVAAVLHAALGTQR